MPMTRSPIAIDDPADPRIAAYRAIRERDLVGREGLFIAEGEVVVRVLLERSLHLPVSLLVAEKRVAAIAGLTAGLSAEVPVFSASQAVMDQVAGFPMHRGILAVGRLGPQRGADALLSGAGSRATVVVLFGIANHDNMGGIFRNAAAFGASAVILDSDCCDPLYRKAIRVSVGAALTLPFARLQRGEDALDLLAAHDFTALALAPGGDAMLSEIKRPDRVAVLFGTEGAGLPEAVLARARTVRIPMAGDLDSLNVATASGIVLHHLAFGTGAATSRSAASSGPAAPAAAPQSMP
jgi:tRNA G18 (ribose-2'-O)-methylase SpoU